MAMRSARALRERGRGRSRAFIVESLVLAGLLAFCLMVFVRLFAAATIRSAEAMRQTEATALAQTQAERFSADPAGQPEEWQSGDYLVRCNVSEQQGAAGTLYSAQVAVTLVGAPANAEPLCALTTARYVARAGGAQ